MAVRDIQQAKTGSNINVMSLHTGATRTFSTDLGPGTKTAGLQRDAGGPLW